MLHHLRSVLCGTRRAAVLSLASARRHSRYTPVGVLVRSGGFGRSGDLGLATHRLTLIENRPQGAKHASRSEA